MIDGTWLLIVFLVLLGLSLAFLIVGLVLKSKAASEIENEVPHKPSYGAGDDVAVKVDQRSAA